MRRKTQIVLAITFMTAILVTFFSYIYVSRILRQRIRQASETTSNLALQIADLAEGAVPELADTRINTKDPEAIRRAIHDYVSTDSDLNAIIDSVVGNWPMVYDAAIVDLNGKAILHSRPPLIGQLVPNRPDFQQIQDAGFRRKLRMIYNLPDVYEVRRSLDLKISIGKSAGSEDGVPMPFGSVRLGVSTFFLSQEITPALRHSITLSGIVVLLSIVLAAGLSHLALGPLERINRRLDEASAGRGDFIGELEAGNDEYGLVTLKIAHLGRQMRDVREVFSALKSNVDQLMANLQEGLMLFTRDSRAVLVSAPIERFLNRPRNELLGRTVGEIFSSNSPLSILVLESFKKRHSIAPCEVERVNGRHLQIQLDFIQERDTQIGALLVLRDVESRKRIGDDIEMSRRIAAPGDTTRAVAHEVKNPINAIVLHLQLLHDKLRQVDPDTRRHMDVIGSEIHRLNKVVEILLEHTRPRHLHVEEVDLRRVLEDVVMLSVPEAERRGVDISKSFADEPLRVRIDTDSMKQAIGNVVLNGLQAMPQGGVLAISSRREGHTITTDITDKGSGIPPEIQEKVFELYFTTKKGGNGIGLAETYKILQLHDGSVDFESVEGKGTTFRLRLPASELPGEANSNQAADSTLASPSAR